MNMNISLTEELAALIREKVASGRYASANDVVREALRLLKQQGRVDAAKIANMQVLVDEGLTSGNGERSMKELRAAARKQAGL
ncbi:MAG: type II toxin-antitoxin system ParD family antitoxin [Beijerinckiaceae bacterium]|nr:type II toxin-antitoxin system ParD family antitoxin [Beijerinckiaceae bacterium]